MRILRTLPLLVLATALATTACVPRQTRPLPPDREPAPTTPESDRQEPEPGTARPAPETAPAPPTLAEASSPAVVALLGQGDKLAGSGEFDRAAASVERALDVEPRNPFVYQRLAALRLEQGQPGQAETLARKSNSLAGDNPPLRARNWALIAEALRVQGDTVGADSAASRAGYYRSQTR